MGKFFTAGGLASVSAVLFQLTSFCALADSEINAKWLMISKTAAARVSHLSDIVFVQTATPPQPQEIDICVFASGGGQYRITATSSNADGMAMRLKSSDKFINYSVLWTAGEPDASTIPLSSGLISNSLSGADQRSESCNGGTNTRLQVSLDASSFRAAPAGNYLDTLSLSITPN